MINLHQHSLRLGEPEGHLHGTVQLDGGGQFGTGLLPLAELGIQGTETVVAMGDQRAHAEILGQGEGLSVVGFGFFDMRRIALRRNVAEEAQDPRLVAAFLVLTGMTPAPARRGRAPPPGGRPAAAPHPGGDYRVLERLPFPLPWSVPSPA